MPPRLNEILPTTSATVLTAAEMSVQTAEASHGVGRCKRSGGLGNVEQVIPVDGNQLRKLVQDALIENLARLSATERQQFLRETAKHFYRHKVQAILSWLSEIRPAGSVPELRSRRGTRALRPQSKSVKQVAE